MKKIRCLIVDDEPYARQKIRKLLENEPDITVAGECGNGPEALASISANRPDLVFLDIQMPDMDGFAVLQLLPRSQRPFVIFVTAFDRYAVSAFDAHALDYLLKPFDRGRFTRALERARTAMRMGDTAAQYRQILALLKGGQSTGPKIGETPSHDYWHRFVIKKNQRAFFVAVDDVAWIKAQGKAVTIHWDGRSERLAKSLGEVMRHLDPGKFFRVHRSLAVNLSKLKEIQPWFWGEYVLVMADGAKLRSGRAYKEPIAALLRQ